MGRPNAADRLLRLLALPAWVAANPGATVEEAARHFGVSVETITRDVEALWVSGPRDAMPDELVDFDALELEEGRLRLTTSLGLDQPLRLTSGEARALRLSLRVLASLLEEDPRSRAQLQRAEQALAGLLGHARVVTSDQGHEAAEELPGPAALAVVRQALASRRRLRLVYVDAADRRTEREVDPEELESDGSYLYLRAWCLRARDERSFRLDRVLEAEVLDVPAAAHRVARSPRARAARREREKADTRQRRATLYLDPRGRWLTEQVPCESVTQGEDGTLAVVVAGRDDQWLTGLVLSCGRHLRGVEPPGLAQRAAEAARRALAADDTLGVRD
ncbi:helix-turn-helix transcriptional regulator [Actinomyces faecalis]|uniref:helix-turn-helix transcriptional regulator n=1 Tax=Actinomyces faecalis TaxID=2722820 RepID=UPI001555DFE0|nr:WYL domain-containing protein [Actinomyces faecalis]